MLLLPLLLLLLLLLPPPALPLSSPLSPLLSPAPSLLFLTGKGGVGKTTITSSLSLLLSSASSPLDPKPSSVLLASTDPADSARDAFELPPPDYPGEVTPISSPLLSPSCSLSVTALSADPSSLLSSLSSLSSSLSVPSLAASLGVPPALLQSLGVAPLLEELSASLADPSSLLPPGADEYFSLLSLLNATNPATGRPYDLVVCDTAPSGHTLRLLGGPRFVDTTLGKVLKFRGSVAGVLAKVRSLGGGKQRSDAESSLDEAVEKIDGLQTLVKRFSAQLSDKTIRIALVGIPTTLSYLETVRTAASVNEITAPPSPLVASLFLNQLLPPSPAPAAAAAFLSRRVRSQTKRIEELEAEHPDLPVTRVPYLDREVAGLPALSFLSSSHLPQPPDSQRTLVFGGKGGVGKTTCAAATAVGLASQGLSVAVISTDPAHSLGDALGSDLSSSPDGVDLTPFLPSPPPGASLRAFEVDPASAIEDLTAALSSLSPPPALSDAGLSPADLGSLLSTLPPGADEVVALGSLVGILERGGYDRVVIDTAPTGHALRLLSYPRFVDDLIERALRVSEKVLPAIKLLGGKYQLTDEQIDAAKSKLLGVQLSMFALDELLSDEEKTAFYAVCVPTKLATEETGRLVKELAEGEVKVKVAGIIVNQVLADQEDAGKWLDGVRGEQDKVVERYERWAKEEGVEVVKVDMIDEEPKGVYGLAAVWPYFGGRDDASN